MLRYLESCTDANRDEVECEQLPLGVVSLVALAELRLGERKPEHVERQTPVAPTGVRRPCVRLAFCIHTIDDGVYIRNPDPQPIQQLRRDHFYHDLPQHLFLFLRDRDDPAKSRDVIQCRPIAFDTECTLEARGVRLIRQCRANTLQRDELTQGISVRWWDCRLLNRTNNYTTILL